VSQRFCVFDYETFSEASIDLGANAYARHHSTEIVVACGAVGTREELASEDVEIHQWCPLANIGDGAWLSSALSDPGMYLVAHNSGFERAITENVGCVHVASERWIDTAALAATHALPRKLDAACSALGLKHQKNPDGKRLIQLYSKPKKPSKKDPSTRRTDVEGLTKFTQYCADDVAATIGIFLRLPPLSKFERKVWLINQEINTRGVAVDRELVRTALKLIAEETKALNAEIVELTRGKIRSANQRAALLKWCARRGTMLPNMQKVTLEDALASGLAQGRVKRALEIRLAISKTSTAKYVAFEERSRFDGRVRDLQMYHGASTGRDAGTGVQPHNMPKPTISDTGLAIETIKEGDLEWLRALHGPPMEALSSCVRGSFAASPGHDWFAADFNAIEARVLFWMAGHTEGLWLFNGERDPYKDQACPIYGKRIEDITDDERQVGKFVFLGSGYQMGPPKFKSQAKEQHGIVISLDLAKRGIKAYRTKHAPVVRMWGNLQRAAISAVLNPGKSYTVNRTKWMMRGDFLCSELPSGRQLKYYKPSVRWEVKWDRKIPVLYHWRVNPKTKQWENRGTYGGRLTENCVSGTSRDLMVTAQLRTQAAGYISLITVHDELNAEKKKGKGKLTEFEALMAELPPWAAGLPVKVKGWQDVRYRK
jgi:DNA polymerase